jgi:lipoate---protein ligase
MPTKITAKVEGGKLLRLELVLTDNRVKSVKISGDFFIHPEDSLVVIEKTLLFTSPDAEIVTITNKIKDICYDQGIQMIGLTAEALAIAFKEAIKRAREPQIDQVKSN